MMKRAAARALALALAGLGATGIARGSPIVIESSFSGGIWDGGVTAPHFMNYFVGYSIPSTPVERRNYFLFNLADVDDMVVGARLKLFLPGPGFTSSDPTEDYRVSGSAAPWHAFYDAFTGVATPAMLEAMFDTMGAPGAPYGTVTISPAEAGSDVVIELLPSALAAINASIGDMFVVTGRLTDLHIASPGIPPAELVFAHSNIPDDAMPFPRLELFMIPEPATAVLLMFGVAAVRRR